jgi:hypothetical protein
VGPLPLLLLSAAAVLASPLSDTFLGAVARESVVGKSADGRRVVIERAKSAGVVTPMSTHIVLLERAGEGWAERSLLGRSDGLFEGGAGLEGLLLSADGRFLVYTVANVSPLGIKMPGLARSLRVLHVDTRKDERIAFGQFGLSKKETGWRERVRSHFVQEKRWLKERGDFDALFPSR